jgi:hypothetical protein
MLDNVEDGEMEDGLDSDQRGMLHASDEPAVHMQHELDLMQHGIGNSSLHSPKGYPHSMAEHCNAHDGMPVRGEAGISSARFDRLSHTSVRGSRPSLKNRPSSTQTGAGAYFKKWFCFS